VRATFKARCVLRADRARRRRVHELERGRVERGMRVDLGAPQRRVWLVLPQHSAVARRGHAAAAGRFAGGRSRSGQAFSVEPR
jgi:hypothetical protein